MNKIDLSIRIDPLIHDRYKVTKGCSRDKRRFAVTGEKFLLRRLSEARRIAFRS